MKSTCKNCDAEFKYMPSQSGGIYCSNRCHSDYRIKQRFTKDTRWNYGMRNYIIRQRGNMCEECGIEEWNRKPLSFHVDHINGNRADNRYDNLKILCPNCHSQTETFGFKNVSKEGKARMIESANNSRRKI